MNDWLCDTSTWDGARTFLDGGEIYRTPFPETTEVETALFVPYQQNRTKTDGCWNKLA